MTQKISKEKYVHKISFKFPVFNAVCLKTEKHLQKYEKFYFVVRKIASFCFWQYSI